jgi:hypothetical protein
MSTGEITVTTDVGSSVDTLLESVLDKSSVSGGGAHNALYIVVGTSRSETTQLHLKPDICKETELQVFRGMAEV